MYVRILYFKNKHKKNGDNIVVKGAGEEDRKF
jgi:hypothetical protein